MLYAPSIHSLHRAVDQRRAAQPDGLRDEFGFWDASESKPVRAKITEMMRTEILILPCTNSWDGNTTTAIIVPSLTIPKFDFAWPYDFKPTGIIGHCSVPSSQSPIAAWDVFRGTVSALSNIGTVQTPVTVAANAVYGTATAVHASHQVWSRGDRIRVYQSSGNTNTGNGQFAPKLIIQGYRVGRVL